MTVPVGRSADSNAAVRGWHAFRRWQRSRPFWGPLLMILAGVELFFSANLNLGGLKIHLGVEGFLSYLLPALMLLSGILVWATPHLRVFYSIIGTVTAVYSMVGLNLGGFLCGMMLGILGGALTFAWTPVAPPSPPTSPAPAPPTSPAPALGDDDGDRITQELDSEPDTEPIDMGVDPELQPVDGDPGGGPPGRDGERPYASLYVCGTVLVLAAVFVGVVQHSPGKALAAPCVSASPAAPAPAAATPAPAPAAPAPAPQVPPEVLATPTPTATAGPPSTPSASPTPAAPSTPAPTTNVPCTDGGSGSPTPSPSSASPTPVPTAPPGPRIVAGASGRLTAATMTLDGLVFEGVADLPTASGSVKVLTFSASKATATDLALATGASGTLTTMVDRPVLNAHVRFDATSFSGKLLGVPFTYTPQTPPQSALPSPSVDLTEVSMDLVFVGGDTFDAAGLVEALAA